LTSLAMKQYKSIMISALSMRIAPYAQLLEQYSVHRNCMMHRTPCTAGAIARSQAAQNNSAMSTRNCSARRRSVRAAQNSTTARRRSVRAKQNNCATPFCPRKAELLCDAVLSAQSSTTAQRRSVRAKQNNCVTPFCPRKAELLCDAGLSAQSRTITRRRSVRAKQNNYATPFCPCKAEQLRDAVLCDAVQHGETLRDVRPCARNCCARRRAPLRN
jgi:hypothetical protein